MEEETTNEAAQITRIPTAANEIARLRTLKARQAEEAARLGRERQMNPFKRFILHHCPFCLPNQDDAQAPKRREEVAKAKSIKETGDAVTTAQTMTKTQTMTKAQTMAKAKSTKQAEVQAAEEARQADDILGGAEVSSSMEEEDEPETPKPPETPKTIPDKKVHQPKPGTVVNAEEFGLMSGFKYELPERPLSPSGKPIASWRDALQKEEPAKPSVGVAERRSQWSAYQKAAAQKPKAEFKRKPAEVKKGRKGMAVLPPAAEKEMNQKMKTMKSKRAFEEALLSPGDAKPDKSKTTKKIETKKSQAPPAEAPPAEAPPAEAEASPLPDGEIPIEAPDA